MHCVEIAQPRSTDFTSPKAMHVDELPMVSVIVPVKNDAERLATCLGSLSRQKYPSERYEIIVVDNGSIDQSAATAIEHGARLLSCPDLRVGALRNRGVEHARGEVLAFIDSDHEAPATWLLNGALELKESLNTRMIGSPCLAPVAGTWVQRGWEKHRLRRRNRHTARWLGAGNMFVRRGDFLAVGGFREDLVAAEDVDLCLRLASLPGQTVSDLRVANVHHGEPATLLSFFKKEYWRGSSGLRAFVVQGMPLAELPTLLYPIYHLVAAAGLLAALCWSVWFAAFLPVFVALLLLVLPGLLMALKTSWQSREWAAFPPLVALYLAYGLARAAALFR